MKSLNYGTLPADLEIDEPYKMRLNSRDLSVVADIVNQGIDSHLEAVFTTQNGREVAIQDTSSLRCFLRRCVESDNGDAVELASSILYTLNYEWI